jgi:hypothetical protein
MEIELCFFEPHSRKFDPFRSRALAWKSRDFRFRAVSRILYKEIGCKAEFFCGFGMGFCL